MQHQSINDNRYQSPGFFRIPSPVSAPGFIRPYRSQESTGSHKHQSENHRHFIQQGQLLNRRPDLLPVSRPHPQDQRHIEKSDQSTNRKDRP